MMESLIFILIIGLFKGALSVQTFERQPRYTEVNPRENATLHCVITNKKGECSWQKNNKPLGMHAGKYEWVGKRDRGDCSVMIIGAVAEFDEGDWECQVTESDVTAQDALTSDKAKLVVRATPLEPRIEHNGSQVLPNHNVTVKSEDKTVLKCVSRYGNPAAILKWFLGEEELSSKGNQSNQQESDNRTFMASSTLELYMNKSHHGRSIRCVAIHESYPFKSRSVEVRLDITYAPEVTLQGAPQHDIEEEKDAVVLKCLANANPPASVVWTRVGSRDIAGVSETLIFKPVNQRDSGTYNCQATNSVGSSHPVSTTLDVKYRPIIRSVGPDKLTTAPLYTSTNFACLADGNPPPKYQWIQKEPNSETKIVRSSDPKMHFSNITYDYQGEYQCVVSNTIGGVQKKIESQPITLQVIGAPQVMKQSSHKHEVIVHRGENAVLRAMVCADPRPRRTAWEWGSSQLEAGAGVGRYRAEELLQDDSKEDCYVARFHVKRVDHADARNYYLTVENERGQDKHSIYLGVRGSYTEPLAMSTIFTVAVGSLVAFVICVMLAVYIVKSNRCCSRRRNRGDFKPSDIESGNNENEKSEISATNGNKPPKIEPMRDNGLHNDLLYCTSPTRRLAPQRTFTTAAGCSPDAMKKKRRPIYESEVCIPDMGRGGDVLPSKSCSEVAISASRVSTFRADYQPNSTIDCGPRSGSRYRTKFSSCKRAKKRNTFNELQMPTVSDNGATRDRMALSYNRQIIVHSDLQTYAVAEDRRSSAEYFCPQTTGNYYNGLSYGYDERVYDEMRSTSRPIYAEKDLI